MRISPTLLLALAALCALPRARAEDPAKIDPTARVDQLAPSPDTTKSVEKVDLQRADQVQASRATLPGLIEEPKARLNGQTAPIEVTETRAKTIIPRKDAPLSTTPLPHQDSAMNGRTARSDLQPKDNLFQGGTGNSAGKFQQRISDANNASQQLRPDISKPTTFDQLNRFIFRRNGPGSEDGPSLVTAAGGGSASTPRVSTPAVSTPPSSEAPSGSFEILGVVNRPGSRLPTTKP